MGLKSFAMALGVPALLLCAAGASAQGARLNPCAEFQTYVDSGKAESLMAQSFQKVCETVGHIELTNDCMTYYSFVNSFGENSPMTQARAQACDASMPGLRDQVAAGPAPDPAGTQMQATDQSGQMDQTGQMDQSGQMDQLADQGQELEIGAEDAGSSGDIAFWDSVKGSDSPEMYQAYLDVYPDGLFAPIARIRVENLTAPVEQAADPAADQSGDDVVAEVAFWNSVKESGSAEMLQSYLDAYPDGLFVPIAMMQIQDLQVQASPPVVTDDEGLVEESAEDTNFAATEMAFWDSVKDSGSPEMLGSYLATYPEGTFAPIARVMIDRLTLDAAMAAEERTAVQNNSGKPKTAAEHYKRGLEQLDKAENAEGDKRDKILKRARTNFRKAGDMGHARALMKFGDMLAEGLGGPRSIAKAADQYMEAARAGDIDGFDKALLLLDEHDRSPRVVETVVEYYKKRPNRAVDTLNTLSDGSIKAVQRMLKTNGYYFGDVDADFGPASVRALNQYARGAPKPTKKVVIKQYVTPKIVVGRVSPLAAKLQRQLKRVWCYRGAIDGIWGPGSRNAMYHFNRWAGAGHPINFPTEAAYNHVRGVRHPVCGIR